MVAVSKRKSWEDVNDFFSLGITDFGENYIQEALEKIDALKQAHPKSEIRWHFIGTLQSNKSKFLPAKFHLFHGLDSLTLAQKIHSHSMKAGKIMDCLLEVNIDEEHSKGGLRHSNLATMLESMNQLSHLRIKGLMCIPKVNGSGRDAFAKLRILMEELNKAACYKEKLTELSMGMSSDFEAAILEGATIVRVGTKLFGERE